MQDTEVGCGQRGHACTGIENGKRCVLQAQEEAAGEEQTEEEPAKDEL